VVAGSGEVPGAAILAATAALRAGAGKLAIATTGSAIATVAAAMPEARVIPLPETAQGGPRLEGLGILRDCAQQAAAVLVGPGMMDADATAAFVAGLADIARDATLIVDALAMDVVLRGGLAHPQAIFTPHAGELAHLTGRARDALLDDPLAAALAHAHAWQATVALKGASTCIATAAGKAWLHEAQTPGLATSGSGDVLAGLIAGLAARGAPPQQAAVWGVALHARAGKALALRQGNVGYLARELAAEIPAILQALAPA
jgi:ADP-dependent NAD(P)H-hydrate dehydratase